MDFSSVQFSVFDHVYLQLLQLSDVGVTLQLQVSHLVFMFLMLMQPLVLLSLLLLGCKLENRDTIRLHMLLFCEDTRALCTSLHQI